MSWSSVACLGRLIFCSSHQKDPCDKDSIPDTEVSIV